MKEKFIVKIPIHPLQENVEYKEIRCKTHKEIADFLQVSPNTVKTLITGNLKFILPKVQHLKGIKIERINEVELNEVHQFLHEKDEQKRTVIYQQQLLDKIK